MLSVLPPPKSHLTPPPKEVLPLARVRPDRVTLRVADAMMLMRKIPEALLPLIVRRSAPGPAIVALVVRVGNWLPLSVRVPVRPEAKAILSLLPYGWVVSIWADSPVVSARPRAAEALPALL